MRKSTPPHKTRPRARARSCSAASRGGAPPSWARSSGARAPALIFDTRARPRAGRRRRPRWRRRGQRRPFGEPRPSGARGASRRAASRRWPRLRRRRRAGGGAAAPAGGLRRHGRRRTLGGGGGAGGWPAGGGGRAGVVIVVAVSASLSSAGGGGAARAAQPGRTRRWRWQRLLIIRQVSVRGPQRLRLGAIRAHPELAMSYRPLARFSIPRLRAPGRIERPEAQGRPYGTVRALTHSPSRTAAHALCSASCQNGGTLTTRTNASQERRLAQQTGHQRGPRVVDASSASSRPM